MKLFLIILLLVQLSGIAPTLTIVLSGRPVNRLLWIWFGVAGLAIVIRNQMLSFSDPFSICAAMIGGASFGATIMEFLFDRAISRLLLDLKKS